MPMRTASEPTGEVPTRTRDEDPAADFPVREYIGAMALELAQMARWDGDEALARLLDASAHLAGEPFARPAVETVEQLRLERGRAAG